ncbi:MAG: HlyD family secretion protein [Syntrophomonas sp.]|nr:HlyD family secretion protein [Syntrophomonas sp.]
MDDNEAMVTPKDILAQSNGKIIKIVVLLAVLLGGMVGGYIWWNNLRTSISTDNAKVVGDIVDISPKVAGRLEELSVQEGAYVEAGQIVAVLDNAQYKINLNQAKASLDISKANYDKLPDDLKSTQATVEKSRNNILTSQAQVKSSEVAVADAKRNLAQNESLFQNESISKEVLETSRSSYAKAQATLEASQATVMANQAALQESQAKMDSLDKTGAAIYLAQLEQAQATYDNAQLALTNSIIKAPISGTVVRLALQVGENVSPGQTIITISNLDTTWISANIEEDKSSRVKVGQDVDVKIDSFPGILFAGKVSELGGATQSTFALISSENSSGNYTKVTQRFSFKITVDKKGLVFKPGMSAVIKIHTGS